MGHFILLEESKAQLAQGIFQISGAQRNLHNAFFKSYKAQRTLRNVNLKSYKAQCAFKIQVKLSATNAM